MPKINEIIDGKSASSPCFGINSAINFPVKLIINCMQKNISINLNANHALPDTNFIDSLIADIPLTFFNTVQIVLRIVYVARIMPGIIKKHVAGSIRSNRMNEVNATGQNLTRLNFIELFQSTSRPKKDSSNNLTQAFCAIAVTQDAINIKRQKAHTMIIMKVDISGVSLKFLKYFSINGENISVNT